MKNAGLSKSMRFQVYFDAQYFINCAGKTNNIFLLSFLSTPVLLNDM